MLLLLAACAGTPDAPTPTPAPPAPEAAPPATVDVLDAALLGVWIPHDTDADCFVHRPDGDLPATRFLDTFTLEPGGVFTTNVLAPNDAHYAATGTWSLTGDVLTVHAEMERGAYDDVWTITELDAGRMCVTGRETAAG
jgi:hypothetical protein